MKTLYIDCFAGISGDMFLGSMLDLGLDKELFLEKLGKLSLHGYEVDIRKSEKKHISGTKVDVKCSEDHPHRGLKDICRIIDQSTLETSIREQSKRAFRLLAEAEGKVHGKLPEEIHFHEVGAMDSIIDIVGAFILVHMAAPERIVFSSLNVGSGTVKCAHGIMPVPAPATAELLRGKPVYSMGEPAERTTPTGALLASCLADAFGQIPSGKILKCGTGIGTRDTDIPNILRIFSIEEDFSCKEGLAKRFGEEKGIVLETNIDDMNPQVYETVMEELFSEGAMDVWLSPIIMKKSRPANTLSCLCSPGDLNRMGEIILRSTSTLGIRTYPVDKIRLNHIIKEIDTSFGKCHIKEGWLGEELIKTSIEYEDLKKISSEKNIPVIQLRELLMREITSK